MLPLRLCILLRPVTYSGPRTGQQSCCVSCVKPSIQWIQFKIVSSFICSFVCSSSCSSSMAVFRVVAGSPGDSSAQQDALHLLHLAAQIDRTCTLNAMTLGPLFSQSSPSSFHSHPQSENDPPSMRSFSSSSDPVLDLNLPYHTIPLLSLDQSQPLILPRQHRGPFMPSIESASLASSISAASEEILQAVAESVAGIETLRSRDSPKQNLDRRLGSASREPTLTQGLSPLGNSQGTPTEPMNSSDRQGLGPTGSASKAVPASGGLVSPGLVKSRTDWRQVEGEWMLGSQFPRQLSDSGVEAVQVSAGNLLTGGNLNCAGGVSGVPASGERVGGGGKPPLARTGSLQPGKSVRLMGVAVQQEQQHQHHQQQPQQQHSRQQQEQQQHQDEQLHRMGMTPQCGSVPSLSISQQQQQTAEADEATLLPFSPSLLPQHHIVGPKSSAQAQPDWNTLQSSPHAAATGSLGPHPRPSHLLRQQSMGPSTSPNANPAPLPSFRNESGPHSPSQLLRHHTTGRVMSSTAEGTQRLLRQPQATEAQSLNQVRLF